MVLIIAIYLNMERIINPKISIITICYNCAEELERTIKSVLLQSYTNIEYIVVDGGSNDATSDVIKKYANAITLWVSEPDNGIYNAMNKGIRMMGGDWVNFMNAGDVFHDNNVISRFVETIGNKNNIVLAYGKTLSIEKGVKSEYKTYPLSTITYRTPFCHQSVFIKNLGKEIMYDEQYRIVADYALFYNLYYKYGADSFLQMEFVVAEYDITDGLSKNPKFKYEQQRERLNIRSRHKDLRWYYEVIKYFVKVLWLGAQL